MNAQRLSALAAASALALLVAGCGGGHHDDDAAASELAQRLQLTPLGSGGACTDGKLSLTFAQPPVLGTSGVIRVFRDDGTLVDAIDLAALNRTPDSPLLNSDRRHFGGAVSDNGTPHLFNYYPVLIRGNTALVHLHAALEPGRSYHVTVDPGMFNDGQGFGGIGDLRVWRFTTKAAAPAAGTGELTVAQDGSGDFCSVQGAIDAVPAGNTRPVTIHVRAGTYDEIVYVTPDKPFVTVRGEDRERTVIQYANNDRFNVAPVSTPDNQCIQRRIPGTPDLFNCWRALFGVEAADFRLENLTLRNTTPAGGSQAEAFRGNAERIVLDGVNLSSLQDTLRLQGAGYVTHSFIEGDVDFTWGTGAVFFTKNELKALRPGYYSMARNEAAVHGNVYVANRLTRAPEVPDASTLLARVEPLRFPYSEEVFIDNVMDTHVAPVGWQIYGSGVSSCAQAPSIRFLEYGSVSLAGQPVDTSQRLACSRQLTADEAAPYRDPAFVLGGWVPATLKATPAGTPPGLTPGPVAPGGTLTVDWSAPSGHAPDAVRLYRVGEPDTAPLAEQATTTATTGSLSFVLPATPGRYELRYFAGGTRTAVSNAVTAQ